MNLPAGLSALWIRHHQQLRPVPNVSEIFGVKKGLGIAFKESSI